MTGEGRIMATLTLHDDPLPLSAEDMAREYDTLTLADVYGALAYYFRHREEVDEYIRQRDVEAEEIRAKFEAEFPPKVSREELRARRDALLRKKGT